jgi:signal transduction histidine kinase
VQEALTNVSKHAGATRVTLDLSLADGVLSLEVSDNGRGIEAGALGKARSFGIRGLHERAGTVGGWIDLSSAPAGAALLLSVPLDAADATAAAGPADPANGDGHDPSAWGST